MTMRFCRLRVTAARPPHLENDVASSLRFADGRPSASIGVVNSRFHPFAQLDYTVAPSAFIFFTVS